MPSSPITRTNILLLITFIWSIAGMLLLVAAGMERMAAPSPERLLFVEKRNALQMTAVALFMAVAMVGIWLAAHLRPADPQALRKREKFALIASVVVAVGWTLTVVYTIAWGDSSWRGLIIALPVSTYALVMLRRSQVTRKLPLLVVALAVGWSIISFGPAVSWDAASQTWLGMADPNDKYSVLQNGLMALTGGLSEELAKGMGIAVLFVLFRGRINSISDGLVIGAAIGLGFNFIESVEYAGFHADQAASQIWSRQIIGIPFGHVTFSALAGAGIGAACSRSGTGSRASVILLGLAAATLGHFTWNFAASLGALDGASNEATAVNTFFLTPLIHLIYTGPFTLAVIIIAVRANRRQLSNLREELIIEASSGRGAIEWPETPALYDPRQRRRLRIGTLVHQGFQAHRKLVRMQNAQIELAMHRHAARPLDDLGNDHEVALRRQIIDLKHQVRLVREIETQPELVNA